MFSNCSGRSSDRPFSKAQIRRFYDRNTSAFVSLGQGRGAIHRAVWGPGVRTREDAFRYVEDQIAGHIATLASRFRARGFRLQADESPLHVVDLGCGVGASLCYLAEQLPQLPQLRFRGTGVTLSPVQARLATERFRGAGLGDRLVCIEGDFNALPPAVGPAHAAYAIESFVHGPDPAAFMAQSAALIAPGGVLAICDDFLHATDHPQAARALSRFRHGWHINALLQVTEVVSLAEAAGFAPESDTDLTPYLELGRPRDRIVDVLVPLLERLPLQNTSLGHLVGGSGLQASLRGGWLGYHLLVFRRRES